jgi:hypothetical protein
MTRKTIVYMNCAVYLIRERIFPYQNKRFEFSFIFSFAKFSRNKKIITLVFPAYSAQKSPIDIFGPVFWMKIEFLVANT